MKLTKSQIAGVIFFLILLLSQGYSNASSKALNFVTIEIGVYFGLFSFVFALLAVNLQRASTINLPLTPYIGLCFILGSAVTATRSYLINTVETAMGFAICGALFGIGIFLGGLLRLRRESSVSKP